MDRVQDVVGSGLQKVREGMPETDHECSYEFRTNRCIPEDQCSFQWRLGDLLPARACRLRDAYLLEMDDFGDEDEHWMAELLEGEGEGMYGREYRREGWGDMEAEAHAEEEEEEEGHKRARSEL